MRYVSQIFQPIITVPKNAKIKNTENTCKSQKLLLECGLVHPTSSGLFALLPLARRALDKLENLIRYHVDALGAQRITLPALTSAQLWEKSGRLENVGTELLRVEDRHEKQYLLAPTHEEAITDLLADVGRLSYKQLPLFLYQINNKYRDEFRPKHGLLRSRQFSMLDAYGAHSDTECARASYTRMFNAYTEIFARLQLDVKPVQAPSGDMGGSMSHEWQMCADVGEDTISVCPSCSHATLVTEEGERGKHSCEKCGVQTDVKSSIEVGHTFILGTRYSEPLNLNYIPPSGAPTPVVMSCYGIGISRLLAASLEALSTDKALRWPKTIAPYNAIIIGPKEGSKEWSAGCLDHVQDLNKQLEARGLHDEVILDDRHALTIGKRLLMADKMGYPYIILCGRSTLESPPRYEVYRSLPHSDASPQLMTLEQLINEMTGDDLKTNVKVKCKMSINE